MQYKLITAALVCVLALPSCVGKKKFRAAEAEKEQTQMTLDESQQRLEECQSGRSADNERLNSTLRNKESELARVEAQRTAYEQQIGTLTGTNARLLDQMSANQLTTQAEAQSIAASLQKINTQSEYIERLNKVIRVKDSTSVALVYNLKKSLENINDEDIDVQVKGTKVFVSISDKLLFKSGAAGVSGQAAEILSKVAKVIKDNPDLEVTVEGHTDNIPISSSKYTDNWELSTARATAVVKDLSSKYGVDPSRLAAAGRGEFMPKADNSSEEGRATNRRTEIILTPKLDQFFKLLEAPTDIPAR